MATNNGNNNNQQDAINEVLLGEINDDVEDLEFLASSLFDTPGRNGVADPSPNSRPVLAGAEPVFLDVNAIVDTFVKQGFTAEQITCLVQKLTGLMAEQNRSHELHNERLRLQKRSTAAEGEYPQAHPSHESVASVATSAGDGGNRSVGKETSTAAEAEHPQAHPSQESEASVATSAGDGGNRSVGKETEDGSCSPNSSDVYLGELLSRGYTTQESFDLLYMQRLLLREKNRSETIAIIKAEVEHEAQCQAQREERLDDLSHRRIDILESFAIRDDLEDEQEKDACTEHPEYSSPKEKKMSEFDEADDEKEDASIKEESFQQKDQIKTIDEEEENVEAQSSADEEKEDVEAQFSEGDKKEDFEAHSGEAINTEGERQPNLSHPEAQQLGSSCLVREETKDGLPEYVYTDAGEKAKEEGFQKGKPKTTGEGDEELGFQQKGRFKTTGEDEEEDIQQKDQFKTTSEDEEEDIQQKGQFKTEEEQSSSLQSSQSFSPTASEKAINSVLLRNLHYTGTDSEDEDKEQEASMTSTKDNVAPPTEIEVLMENDMNTGTARLSPKAANSANSKTPGRSSGPPSIPPASTIATERPAAAAAGSMCVKGNLRIHIKVPKAARKASPAIEGTANNSPAHAKESATTSTSKENAAPNGATIANQQKGQTHTSKKAGRVYNTRASLREL